MSAGSVTDRAIAPIEDSVESTDLDNLEALARAATAGPWKLHRGEVCYRSDEDDQSYGMLCPVDLELETNAEFCAAANPAAVLKLIAATRSAIAAPTSDQQAGAVAKSTNDPDRCNGRGCEVGCASCMTSPSVVSTSDAQQLAELILVDLDGGCMKISSDLEFCADGAMRFTVTNPETGRRFGVHLGLAELETDKSFAAPAAIEQAGAQPVAIYQARTAWPSAEWKEVTEAQYNDLNGEYGYEVRIVYTAATPATDQAAGPAA